MARAAWRTQRSAVSETGIIALVLVAVLGPVAVVFGKNKARVIAAMDGQNEITKGLAQHLSDFARARTMFVAPSNVDDLQKMAAMQPVQPGAASAALAGGGNPLQTVLGAHAAASVAPLAPAEAAVSTKFCPHCGASNPASVKFCVGCGTKFI